MRALLRGEGLLRPSNRPAAVEFRPIARDLRELIRAISSPNDNLVTRNDSRGRRMRCGTSSVTSYADRK